MTMEMGNPKDIAKKYLSSIGLSPSIMDMVPSQVISRSDMDKMSPGAFGVYNPERKAVYLTADAMNSPHAYIHEYFHALQDSLNPQDKDKLEELMQANPPEGNADTGFIGYPGGAPTVHHSIWDTHDNYGLSSYIDYNYTNAYKPDAETFRSSVDQPWHKMPEPVLSFLQSKFPYIPQKQFNNWNISQ